MSATLHDAAWHAKRARVIGGSEIAALFDCQPPYAMSKFALWHVKAGNTPPPPVDNERVRWGNRLERVIAEIAAAENGWTIEPGQHVADPTTPGLGATLDFTITNAQAGLGALEIKNTDWLQHRRAWLNNEPPPHILLQLQHQLAATGYKWGVVVALVGGNQLEQYPYEAKPNLIAEIRRRVTAFWRSIDDGVPPPVDASDSATAILKALYPDPVDEIADLTADNELPEICAGILHSAEKRKAIEKAEAEFKNRLRDKLGAHLAADAQGFRIRVAVTAEKPDRVAQPGEVIKGRASSQRFTIKELTT